MLNSNGRCSSNVSWLSTTMPDSCRELEAAMTNVSPSILTAITMPISLSKVSASKTLNRLMIEPKCQVLADYFQRVTIEPANWSCFMETSEMSQEAI